MLLNNLVLLATTYLLLLILFLAKICGSISVIWSFGQNWGFNHEYISIWLILAWFCGGSILLIWMKESSMDSSEMSTIPISPMIPPYYLSNPSIVNTHINHYFRQNLFYIASIWLILFWLSNSLITLITRQD